MEDGEGMLQSAGVSLQAALIALRKREWNTGAALLRSAAKYFEGVADAGGENPGARLQRVQPVGSRARV